MTPWSGSGERKRSRWSCSPAPASPSAPGGTSPSCPVSTTTPSWNGWAAPATRSSATLTTARRWSIAKVKGHCIAGGLELALACDLIYASERTKFGVTEIGMGILPGWGGTVRLAKSLPIFRAREILLSGRKDYTAREFYEMGLLTRVYPEEEFEAGVDEMVAGFCQKTADALRMGKAVLNQSFQGIPWDTAMMIERTAIAWLFHSDHVQALRQMALNSLEAMKKNAEQGG